MGLVEILKKTIPFLFLVFSFKPTISQASNLNDLYRKQECDQVISLLQELYESQQNEDSLYYLALCYVQKKEFKRAKQVLISLLKIDPDFYIYKIKYDLGLSEVLKKTDLEKTFYSVSKGRILDQIKILKHQIVLNDAGLFLFKNGVKIILSDQTNFLDAGFIINNDAVYFTQADKKNELTLLIYSILNKRIVYKNLFKKGLNQIRFKNINSKILMQSNEGYLFFDAKSLNPLTPFLSGAWVKPMAD